MSNNQQIKPEDILFEDAYLIAVDKPAGLMVEPDRFNHPNLVREVEAWLQHKVKIKSGLGVIHRLDRPVSGVILFAKTPLALKSLNEQIANGKTQKIYRAWVEGNLREKKGTWKQPLGRSEDRKKAAVEVKQVKRAITHWTVLFSEENRTLLELNLETGRFHQIRAHCGFNGHPIIGDSTYGSTEAYPTNCIALRSVSYTFTHPKSGERMEIRSNTENFQIP